MLLSHKTFFSLAVKTQKVYLLLKQNITAPFFSLFPLSELYSSFSLHCLTSFFFEDLLRQATYQWQRHLDTMQTGDETEKMTMSCLKYDIHNILCS